MANNRLYIKNAKTGERLFVAKSFGHGWIWRATQNKISTWLAETLPDDRAAFGNTDSSPSELCFVTENEDAAPPPTRWCPHVGGLGPPFPFCEICARTSVGGWVPCAERLPKAGEFVLAKGPKLGSYVGGPTVEICRYDGSQWWVEGGTELASSPESVTHWAPLLT